MSEPLQAPAFGAPRLSELEPVRKQRLRHDLRQSLGTVMTLVAVVEQNMNRVPEVLKRLDQIRTETEWMATLVSSDSPRAVDLQTVDVGEVVADVWSSAVAAGRCTMQLVRDASACAVVDRVELARSVRNLVDNAMRAAGEDGGVVVHVRNEPDAVTVVIRDSGPGFGNIPPQQGLGLLTVRRFAARCGGSLEVDRSLLGGAKLILRLPRVSSDSGSPGRGA